MIFEKFTKVFVIKLNQVSLTFLLPKGNVFHNCIILIYNFLAVDQNDIITAAGRG